MRKLKLQSQMSVDGFVGRPGGEIDWLTWNWDDKIKEYVNALTDSVDTILLGRKMTEGFISHWTSAVADPEDENYLFAKKMVNTPKVVFSKTLHKSPWDNTVIAGGELKDEISKLKLKPGKGIIVYGGASFVSSLVEEGLIDEYHLFVNPAVIGTGLSIFRGLKENMALKLIESKPFKCGIVMNHYEPVKQ